MQDAWHQEITKGLQDGEANLQTWWTILKDPVLNTLIERAYQGNLQLKEAFARIKEARANRGIKSGERFPDLNSTGDARRMRSPHTFLPPTTQRSRTDEFFKFGGEGSWEIDFWGRIDRSIESADASLDASMEDYRDVLVMLYADVSTNYVEVRALQDRIKYVRGNIGTQRKSLQLTKDRFDVGLAPDLDVQQAKLNLAKTESTLPTLQMQLVQTINRLGVLLGEHPDALHDELEKRTSIPKPSGQILFGLPVELLRQRPDIRQAERELAAQTALIGVAKADLYPSFSLFGTFEIAANDFSDVFSYSKSRMHSFGPSFRWNIFDGGRVRNKIRVEDARTEQALNRYEQTVLNSLEDVENAMVSYVQEKVRRNALERSVKAARKSTDLVRTLYISGLTDFQNVQEMERFQFEQEDQFAESEGKVIQNLISIYRSLGGGWDPGTEKHE
ncbi:outer membrane protein [Candidatus Scalindua japonica]|uniref:Outer membrane protein n=2 Tax=Candidatus Scalindua japonica TaxID=1284222 RepID=A0A286U181_9BACT|nr:outer membrane protein [Candidatus Scalindua japonica]